jgi:hypothetical protein
VSSTLVFGDHEESFTMVFAKQDANQFHVDLSDRMGEPWHIGSDGKICWQYFGREGQEELLVVDFNEIDEKNISICNLFNLVDTNVADCLEQNNLEYMGTDVLDGRECYLLSAWRSNVRQDRNNSSIELWWVDAETYLPTQMIRDAARTIVTRRYVYDRINAPIGISEFRPDFVQGIEPQRPEPLGEKYDSRYITIFDGTEGGVSIWWGMKGQGGTRNRGASGG